MIDLTDILKLNHNIPPEAANDMKRHAELIEVQKGEMIVEQGRRCNFLYFVADGLFRVSFCHNGQEDTICFGHDGDPFMSMTSYYAQQPAFFSCVAMTSSKVYRITFDDFNMLLDRHIDLLKWMNNILVEQLYAFERKYAYFSSSDAYGRFLKFVGTRPDIMEIIPAKYVAQYLNIRPETLYRLRARFLRSRQ